MLKNKINYKKMLKNKKTPYTSSLKMYTILVNIFLRP